MIEFKEALDDGAVAVVADLAQKIWTEHFTPIIGAPQVAYMLREFQTVAAIKRYLAQNYKYYISYIDGVPAGYIGILAKPGDSALFLSKIYLLAEHRGKGAGRQMMAFVEDLARRGGLKKIFLNTNKKNQGAICFYEKSGFVKRCSDVIDLGGGFVADDWLMEKAV